MTVNRIEQDLFCSGSSAPPSSTRDAVELSIEMSKDDKDTTWEKSAASRLAQVSRWEDGKKKPAASSSEHSSD